MRSAPDIAPSVDNPYLAANFAPIDFETTSFALPFEGEIPRELNRRFLRIGPNPVRQLPNREHYHWFTGTGLLHGLRLSDGKADWYRSRYVRVGPGPRAMGLPALPGPNNGDYAVNTNVVRAGDAWYALVEAGAYPVEFSYELESITRSNLGGLTRGFSAHPKEDPVTGDLHALAYQPGQPNVQYIVVGRDGIAAVRCEISLPHMPQIHDIALTASSIVILDLPVTFKPTPNDSSSFPYRWNEKQDARVGLLPRSGDSAAIQWFAAPRCFVFHILNSYESGDTVVVYVCRHSKMFATDFRGTNERKPVLARWELNRRTATLTETIVEERGTEFPRINSAFEGLPNRYGYTAGWKENVQFGPIMKHDLMTGETEVHDAGPGRLSFEPVFVAREGATSEDDGWILDYVFDCDRNVSDVVIINARDFSSHPIATIKLPVRVPFGFHGAWSPDR